jgi:lipoprotein-releasing system permease protein
VPFESFIGWRYLFRLRRRRRRSLLVALALCLALCAAGASLFLTRAAPLAGVSLFLAGALLSILAALLSVFSAFTTVAVAGVMLGVAALIVVLSVTSGFESEFRDKVLGVNAHVIIMKTGSDFGEYEDVIRQVRALPQVVGAAPFLFEEMQAARGAKQSGGLLLKGIDPLRTPSVLDLPRNLERGSEGAITALRRHGSDEPGIIIGRGLAQKLGVRVGDSVTLFSPRRAIEDKFGLKPAPAAPKTIERPPAPPPSAARVVGIFHAGFDEYDRRLVYLDIAEAQKLFDRGDTVSGVEMKLRDPYLSRAVVGRLDRELRGPYRILDWEELNHNLFTALRTQKVVISLFLVIILVVAAFNIVASLTMTVVNKRREVAILKSMGARSAGVARVFQVAGMTIGAIGTSAGILFGTLVCVALERFGYPLDPKIYLSSRLPVRLNALEIVATAAVTLLVCFLATIIPALRASNLHPVEGLRQE